MARYFNNQEVELLAPAGTFDIFKAIVKTNCDAIYLGGKKLNMRMIRPKYNLSNDEIIEAVKLAHIHGKKLYVTVNNLNNAEDLKEAKDYLRFLSEDAKPDGIIVADMAIIRLVKEMNLNLTLHSSVMMNVHNVETIKALWDVGVRRVVVSRDFSLQAVKTFKDKVKEMEYEYFTHGDMCTVHGSQCYFSSLLFGMSSNRGRCLKPCRWWYKLKKDGNVYDPKYPLAAKDMCMIENLPEMIEAGVTSFKIEGRMREKEFIVDLINTYGDALDRYIEDPLHYDRHIHSQKLNETRKRDFSTCHAFGNPGLEMINLRWEGTGKFYSTGKMFSKPTVEKAIDLKKVAEINSYCEQFHTDKHKKLTVKVNNAEQAKLCISKGVDCIYLSGNVYQPDKPFSIKEIEELCAMKGDTKIILGTPKIMDEYDFSRYEHILNSTELKLDGISVSNLGALEAFKQYDYPMYGDYAFNFYNSDAINYYQSHGLDVATVSIESPYKDLIHTIQHANIPTEVIVHGTVDVMHLELDLYENIKVYQVESTEDNRYVDNEIMVLCNEAGEYPVYRDERGRNHLHNAKELNLSPIIDGLFQAGVDQIRIEGQTYSLTQLETIITYYQGRIKKQKVEELKSFYEGFTLGAVYY